MLVSGCGKPPAEQEQPKANHHHLDPYPVPLDQYPVHLDHQPLSGHHRPLSDQFSDPSAANPFSDHHHHPLRILSEENLTVVSTFVADLNDLDDPDDDDDDCSVSKLSFFEVPDLREEDLQISDDKYFETRLRELTRMTETKKREPSPVQPNLFTDPRFKDVDTKDGLSTFNPSSEKAPTKEVESGPETIPEVMSPQRQFLLLNQTLRRPDGSSNPDMDLVTSSCDPAYPSCDDTSPSCDPATSSCNPSTSCDPATPSSGRVPSAKRSPGSGQSNSDPEDEPFHKKPSEYSTPSHLGTSKKEPAKKKEISNIAFMLLRLFGSSRKKSTKKGCEKRSKSCDRELDSATAPPPPPQKSIKSASSSPMKRTDRKTKTDSRLQLKQSTKPCELSDSARLTPSTLSLATEWEFQAKEDEANGNQELLVADNNYINYLDDPRLTSTYQYSAVLQRQERKSSGYDSLEGENSSLDSGNGNGTGSADISPRAGDPWTNVYRTTDHYRTPVTPDQYSRLYAELDDIAMLKLEINRHPDILNKNY